MLTPHYVKRYSDCPICACDALDAGDIDDRLKQEHWPQGAFDPDFEGMQKELDEQFGVTVTQEKIKEHWELHISLRMDGYREWAQEKTKDSAFGDPFEMRNPYDER